MEMEAQKLEPMTRSLSSRVILIRLHIVQISLHLPSKSLSPLCCIFFALSFSEVAFSFFFFRYSSINEINKITLQNNEIKVFVYFITRLPRMEGGTSYVGFHGGKVLSPSVLRSNHLENSPQRHFFLNLQAPGERLILMTSGNQKTLFQTSVPCKI